MKRLNIAVIGVGYIGYHHARILKTLDGVNLFCVVDSDKKRAEEVASEFDCLATSDYHEVINDVDCFCIATPTQSHYQIAWDCVNHGRHVFIEKPITDTSQEAASLIQLCHKKGVSIQVGHVERFNPVFKMALTLDKKPLLFYSERLSPFLERARNIDVAKDLLIHDIDLILTFMRVRGLDTTIKKINCNGICVVTDKPDVVMADIEFSCGITAHIRASRIERDRKRMMTIYHKDGYITLDYQNLIYTTFKKDDISFQDSHLKLKDELLKEELNSFINAIRHNTPVVVPADEALEALMITEEINRILGEDKA
ncbi:MAG: Gfo/Idh/MocA family oxidoreductase [Thermodesulfovibrionales bacterium]|nr:Gfo/Idh/MocA family oxidoreductase [Thermodesulfovibrionales bacterium]